MVIVAILKSVGDSFSMKYNHGLILWIFKSVVNYVKYHIIYLSLLLFVDFVRMPLQSYTYMTYMYLFPMLDVMRKSPHRYE